MLKLAGVLVLAATLIWTGAAAADEREDKAVAAAQSWLALVDAGKFGESHDTASAYFKGAITKEKWEAALNGTRAPLGKLVSREVTSKQHVTQLPGAPDGDYVVIQFKTSFANKQEGVETVTPMLEKDGAWRISGYFIR